MQYAPKLSEIKIILISDCVNIEIGFIINKNKKTAGDSLLKQA